MTEDLQCTTIARWYTGLAETHHPRHNHWRTKTKYYVAVTELLTASSRPPTWRAIIEAARPSGSRSTFYEVAGHRARHSMVAALITDGSLRSYEIAVRYPRADTVEALVDEAKVWSFWSYRQSFITSALSTPPDLEDTLVTWARAHPALAAANDYRPPACAVEDLTVLCAGRLAATRAATRLTDILRQTALADVT